MQGLAPVLLDVLGCPHCKGALRGSESPSLRLHCTQCRLSWPVEDGVPRLTPDQEMAKRPAPQG
ncbi:Trm112 family protein [Myxococcus sp. Y35]|uniref:Trm112 family protein n=1 Tax=Pseudomyxococcus flavus TaxID=3115648 RepID=UPI003CE710CB